MFDFELSSSATPLLQSEEYARAAKLLSVPTETVSIEDDGIQIGKAQMQSRWWPGLGWVGLISRGPIWLETPNVAAFAAALHDLGHLVLLNSDGLRDTDLSAHGFWPLMTPATLAVWRIDKPTSALEKGLHQKWRNRLRKAETQKISVAVSHLPPDPGHWLLRQEKSQRKARRYKALSERFTLAYAAANPSDSFLFEARVAGEPVAGLLFLRHGAMATYHIGFTSESGRALGAHTLLMMRAAEHLSVKGVSYLELGMLDTVRAPGLARFKLGTGAEAHCLGGTWLYGRKLSALARLWR